MPKLSPPIKIAFAQRREREFLYLSEVDALIAALDKTRSPVRNQALAILLFCQALQPIELCWLRWCDVNEAEKILLVTRNRSTSTCNQSKAIVNLQPLCGREIDQLKQLYQQRTTDWIFASERKQRLSERSLHHIIKHAGKLAKLRLSTHPYMLRRSGLYYRAALLLNPLGLSLRECCLLWNWHYTSIPLCAEAKQEYLAIERKREEGFLAALERMKVFSGISSEQNLIDYLLGAFLLFPRLQSLPHDYWLAPAGWQETLPKTFI